MELSLGVNKNNKACMDCFFMRGMIETADGLETDIKPDATDWDTAFAYCYVAMLHNSSDVKRTREYVEKKTARYPIPEGCPNMRAFKYFKIVK